MANFARHATVASEQPAAAHHSQAEACLDIEKGKVIKPLGSPMESLTQAERVTLLEEKALTADPLSEIDSRVPLVEQMNM